MRHLYRDRDFFVVDDAEQFGIAVFGEMEPDEAIEFVYLFTEEYWSIDLDWEERQVSEGWARLDAAELIPASPEEPDARPYMFVDLS